MKNMILIFTMAAASAAFTAPTLTINSVTQRWPFSPMVDVSFTIGNAEGECYGLENFAVYDGDREVKVDDASAFVNRQSVYGGGTHTLTFDPTRTGLTNIVAVQHFRVGFDLTEAPVRYLIVDLMKQAGEDGVVEYVCKGDPRLETYVKTIDYTDGGTPAQTTIHYEDAFLSVTNGTLLFDGKYTSPYAINKMVFRLVNPGTYRVGKDSVATTYNSVTFTKPYFIQVGLLTRGQYGCMRYGDYKQKDSGVEANYAEQSKMQPIYLDDLRGAHDDPVYPVDWIQYGHTVCPTSFVGRARAKYGLAFDQPTEAQWEVAARAGTTGYYYVDADLTAANASIIDHIGYSGNNSLFPAYKKLANGWGIFDLLGLGQSVLDNGRQGTAPNSLEWPSGTDPVGTYSTWYGRTFSKGGGHASTSTVACGTRADTTSSNVYQDWTSPYYNAVRLVINVD